MTQLTGILLAAGQSNRFGTNKLLTPLSNGIPLIVHSARLLKTALPNVVVVVNPGDRNSIALLERENIRTVLNYSAEAGMGTSIAHGVHNTAQSDGWVIALADMPYIKARTIRSVATSLRHDFSICAPRYGNRRGHPVAFGRGYAQALKQLDGDQGARSIITSNRTYLELIETEDPGVITDVDYPQDIRPLYVD